jgi:2-(1,2-epoxy-1,2-dihydrophenyl)acetyl-CoA isomerase
MAEPSMYSFIEYSVASHVAHITLNRPDKLNSFTGEMAQELQAALDEASSEEVRAVLLTANGRAFCAGQDLPEVLELEKDDNYVLGDTVDESYNPIVKRIRNLEKPVVCAVNGTAAGAGANLAFSCDITFASDQASFIQSFAHIGLIPDTGGTYLLPRLVGPQKAAALAMLGEKISAAEATELGLIYKVIPHDELMDEVTGIAKRLAGMPTKGLAYTKKLLQASLNNGLDEQLQLESEYQSKAGQTEDYKEGVDAFINKRKPKFTGN